MGHREKQQRLLRRRIKLATGLEVVIRTHLLPAKLARRQDPLILIGVAENKSTIPSAF